MIRCAFCVSADARGSAGARALKMRARCRAGTTAAPPCTAGTAWHIAGSVDVRLERKRAHRSCGKQAIT